jgi:hypothetical protein
MPRHSLKHNNGSNFADEQLNDTIEINSPTLTATQSIKWNISMIQDDLNIAKCSDHAVSIQPKLTEHIQNETNIYFEDKDDSQSINTDDYNEEMEITDSCDEEMNSASHIYLHNDSNIKLLEVCLLLLAFKNRFTLDNTCFEALLVLIHFFLPFGNNLPTTLTKLHRVLSINNNSQLRKKQFCSTCQFVISDSMCQNSKCKDFGKVSRDFDTFHFISIKKQLKLNVQFFYEQIKNYKNENKKFTDITNSGHKNKMNSNQNSLDLMLYSDGVRLRKNNKKFWPVFLSLCELPLILRDSKSNKIIAGISYFLILFI